MLFHSVLVTLYDQIVKSHDQSVCQRELSLSISVILRIVGHRSDYL